MRLIKASTVQIFHFFLAVLVMVFPVVIFAADGPPPDFIVQHPGVVSWGIGFVLAGLFILLAWYVKNSDDNNKEQWRHINEQGKDIVNLKIADARRQERCEVNHSTGGRRDYDPEVRQPD